MKRLLSIGVLVLFAASAFATDRFNNAPEQQVALATTGRIIRIDLKSGTLKVRTAESQPPKNVPEIKESLWQRIGVKMPSVRMPGLIAIALPGRTSKISSRPPDTLNPNEFLVVTTDDTLFQDGSDPLQLEDFHVGETISIHGVLSGSTLKASRIAKWD
jgi:hypothetical protein